MICVPVQYTIAGAGAESIAANVEEAISGGALAPGDALPPIRELAGRLGVNANTVAAAYRLLRDRGAVETAGRRGTRVRHRPATTPRSLLGLDVPAGARDLSTGNPDPALLPIADARFPQAGSGAPLLYGQPPMSPELIDHARATLAADGVPAEHLAVTSGALDGIERALSAHLRPGDRVIVEDPGWANLLDLLAALGLSAEPVRVDDDGPLVADMARALGRGARALIVTTRAQNPTGAALSADRAGALRGLLASEPMICCLSRMTTARASPGRPCTRWPGRLAIGPLCDRRRRPTGPTCGSPSWPATVAPSSGCTGDCGWDRAG